MIDILVLNYNDAVTTASLVESVKGYSCVRKILVVDNHSADDSLNVLRTLENDKIVVVDSGRNGGYGSGNNFGIKYLCSNFNSEHILICNPDVSISEDSILKLSLFLKYNDEYAIVAPLMNIPGKGLRYGALKEAGILPFIMSVEMIFSKKFSPLYLDISDMKEQNFVDVFSVAGSLFMIDARKMVDTALYDENMFLYFEEFVLGKRCKQNKFKVALLPRLSFIHNHSVSISKSYKSTLNRQKVYLRSYRYVVKHYFEGNVFYRVLSYVLSAVSLFEIFVWSRLKKL